MTSIERFMQHVRKIETGCWIWTGCVNASGYGTFRDGKKTWLAHRWSYVHIGKHAEPPELHHKCRVKLCVNPADVIPTDPSTHPDKISVLNLLKTSCPQGHPYDKKNTYVDPQGYRHCRACRKISDALFYRKHHEEVRESQRKYHAKNKERVNARRRLAQ